MADKLIPLQADPRWVQLVERYADDIVAFGMEVCSDEDSLPLSIQQQGLMVAVAPARSRVSVASGHGTGKTFSLSIIAFWHLTCHPESHTLLTANDIDQLKSTFWKEFGKLVGAVERGPFAWLAAHVEVMADATARIRGYEATWFIESKTANNKNANKLAGRHGKHFMVIGDEASSLPDPVLVTLSGALTEASNRFLLTSQYTRTNGFFARTQTELSREYGGQWDALQLSSAESPFVSDEAFKEMWDSYDEDERAVRLLGLPPQNASGLMMGQRDALEMYQRGVIIKPGESYGWLQTTDVASGEGLRDKSASLSIKVTGWGDRGPNARRVEVHRIPIFTNDIRSNRLAGHLMDAGADLPNVTHVVDSGGLGINVCQDLQDNNRVLHRVNWGSPCFRSENRDRYINLRAQAMHQAARAAKEGRLSILTQDYRRDVIAQAARIPKAFGSRGRMQVPEKHSEAWEGMPSPDLWDAVCFAFLENVAYIGIDCRQAEDGDALGAAVDRLRSRRVELLATLKTEEAASAGLGT